MDCHRIQLSGSNRLNILPDPDIANGLPLGRNDHVYVKTGEPSQWQQLGLAVEASDRKLPVVSADANDNLYFGSFGGRFNVLNDGVWLADLDSGDPELIVPSLSGDKLGFLRVAAAPDGGFACMIWEEGPGVRAANDNAADNFDLVFSTLDLSGQIGN